MPALGTLLMGILKFVLSDKVLRNIAADQIDRLVKATDTTIDDKIAAPLLKYLRR